MLFVARSVRGSIARWLNMPIKDWDAQHRVVARPELKSLAAIPDADARLYLRFYLRSNMDRDQDIAKARCAAHGIDYLVARQEALTERIVPV